MSISRTLSIFLASIVIGSGPSIQAQTATGTISGTITDASGAVVPSATVTVTNKATGIARTLTANSEGLFTAPALQAGNYEVRAEMQGFRTEVRDAQVLAGSSTTVNMSLSVGTAQEVVNVEAATAQINYDSNTVQGSIERSTIQDIPLNGRSFLQLASLEPGVTVVTGAQGARNAPIQISILGGATNLYSTTNSTLITLDGLSVMDRLDGGNTDLNFSQEMVQEFQITSLNFDLGTGITSNGAVNVVSRSGGNTFHGSGFYFYRDHNMAAYPGLARSTLDPNPYFTRKNPGGYIGGPIIKDKLFFFFNYEATDQVQAVTFQPDIPVLQPLANNFDSPARYHYPNIRFDYRISDKHTAFLRYTHDGNAVFGPEVGAPSEPSAWINLNNWSDQFAMGLTSTLTPNLVNDFRLGWRIWDNKEDPPTLSQCQSPCVDANGPNIYMIGSAVFSAGVTYNASQRRIARHYEPQDTLSWQKGSHRFKFGGDLDVYVNLWYYGLCAESCTVDYAPGITQAIWGPLTSKYFPNLPTQAVTSTADLNNLELYSAYLYAGNLIIPGRYHQDSERRDLRPRVYFQDTWKIRPNITVNYGLAWSAETGDYNSDLPNPQFLAPILGGNLKPTGVNWLDFGPAAGFTWSPGKSGKTVIRGGAGIYYDTMPGFERMENVGEIGPLGNGPIFVGSNIFPNTLPGIVQLTAQGVVPLPIGAPIPSGVPTNITVGEWEQIFHQDLAGVNALVGPTPPKNGAYSVTALDVAKTGSYLYPPNDPITRSYQTSLGVQRDLGHDMVVQADWARRLNTHTQLVNLDLNHFNEFVNGVQTPAIPVCTTAGNFTPTPPGTPECSTGALGFNLNQGRSVYEGLLVKLQKRFSHRYQFTVSYALQNMDALVFPFNLNNWFGSSYGPVLPRHNLNISGVVNLPWGFQLSLNSSMISRSPFNPVTTGVDLTGTGANSSTPIPGPSFSCFNMGCGKSDLATAVANFNKSYAGTKAANNTPIPAFVLPPDYQFGDPTFAQDFRVTKTFTFKERYSFLLFGEMFNSFNIANLTGYANTLDVYNAAVCGPLAAGASTTNCAAQTYAFGQPTQRAGQTFLSNGPRAFQIGGRFTF